MTQETIQTEETRPLLVDLLIGSCLELFESYNVDLQHCDDTSTENQDIHMVALLGLSDSDIRSSFTLTVSQNILKHSFPSDDNVSDDDLQDWLGELSNQLAGRLKNKVVPYGRKLDLGVPTVIKGDNLQIDLPKNSIISKHLLTDGTADGVGINYSTIIESGFFLTEPEESNEAESEVLAEGEMLFF